MTLGDNFCRFLVFKSLVNLYFDTRKSVSMYVLFSSSTSTMLLNNVSGMQSVGCLSVAFCERITPHLFQLFGFVKHSIQVLPNSQCQIFVPHYLHG